MRIRIGKTAQEGIDAHVGGDPVAAARAALRFYADRSSSGVVRPPTFLRPCRGSRQGQSLELALDSEVEALLRREAVTASLTAEDVAAHAVLVYLAELDAVSMRPRGRG